MHVLLRTTLTTAVVGGLALLSVPVSAQVPTAPPTANAPYQDLSLSFEAVGPGPGAVSRSGRPLMPRVSNV
jgi:hypothetical protein